MSENLYQSTRRQFPGDLSAHRMTYWFRALRRTVQIFYLALRRPLQSIKRTSYMESTAVHLSICLPICPSVRLSTATEIGFRLRPKAHQLEIYTANRKDGPSVADWLELRVK